MKVKIELGNVITSSGVIALALFSVYLKCTLNRVYIRFHTEQRLERLKLNFLWMNFDKLRTHIKTICVQHECLTINGFTESDRMV